MPSEDREEAHVLAVADSIREALDGSQSDEDANQLVEAAMGDETAPGVDDEADRVSPR